MRGEAEEVKPKLFKFPVEEGSECGGCNWETSVKYVIATSEEEARRLLDEGVAGLCADCICELLVEGGYVIVKEQG